MPRMENISNKCEYWGDNYLTFHLSTDILAMSIISI